MDSAFDFNALVDLCRQTHEAMQGHAARAVDTGLAARNWLFGWYIVEYEQKGADRAQYGKRLIERLSVRLNPLGIRGVSKTRLKLYRLFYLQYRQIGPTVPDLSRISPAANGLEIGPTPSDQSWAASPVLPVGIARSLSAELAKHLALGWSHYVELLTIEEPDERRFYEIEAQQNGWGVRELKRQIASSLYERLALSRDKDEIVRNVGAPRISAQRGPPAIGTGVVLVLQPCKDAGAGRE